MFNEFFLKNNKEIENNIPSFKKFIIMIITTIRVGQNNQARP